MLDAVQDHSLVITENNIAVLSHQLYHQEFAAEIAHIVEMLDLKGEYPFQARLGDG